MYPQSNDNTVKPNLKGGEVTARQTRRGIAFEGYNFEKKKTVNFGTVRGDVFEKEARVYESKQGLCLTETEYGLVLETAVRFIRIIVRGRGTFSIAVQDFDLHKEPLYNRQYGGQWLVPLKCWEFTSKIGKRNAVLDNSVREQPRPLLPEIKQLGLFGG